MLKGEKNTYRGLEYMITALGGRDRWEWVFYPREDAAQAQRGEVEGTPDKVEVACKSAIDAWLDAETRRA